MAKNHDDYRPADPTERTDAALRRTDTFKSWERKKYLTNRTRLRLETFIGCLLSAKTVLTKNPFQRAEEAYLKYCRSRLDNNINDPISIVEWKDISARLADLSEDVWQRMADYERKVVPFHELWGRENARKALLANRV